MQDDALVIRVELTVDGDSVTGRASSGAGPAPEFSGRIGLMAAIDQLIEVNREVAQSSNETGGA